MSTVAFIGLGAMGSRMAMNLHAAGHKLRVYNRDRAKAKPFAAKGIEVCDSPAAAAKGVFYLDAPVSGSLAQAQGKELVILVGGDKAAFEKAQAVLGAMGRMVRRIGDSGAGATLKLINNMLSASLTAAMRFSSL